MRKLYFLPQGANIAAYRNVAIVSDSAAVSEVVFTSGGGSNYPDPHFMARPHSTNVVRILVGKNYTVTSDAPIRCVWTDDDETLVWTNGEKSLSVERPLRIICTPGEPTRGGSSKLRGTRSGSGGNFNVTTDPPGINGTVTWSSNCCCQVVGSGMSYSYTCDGTCPCAGCQASGSYVYWIYGETPR